MSAEASAGGPEVRLSSYPDCRDAYRHRDLRQALYDESVALMGDVIVNLHGEAHRDRRRLENRLFRRDVFVYWEREVMPHIVERVLEPAVAIGKGDLISLARRAMMTLAVEIAGVDLAKGSDAKGSDAEFDDLYELMTRLSRASTVVHATGAKADIISDGLVALEEFDARFLQPSLRRRVALIESGSDELPPDVLTTLLVNQDALDLPPDVVRREVAYFPWVGSHSTSNALAHAMDHIFAWIAEHPGDRRELSTNSELTQRFVHESLRLHPPSPVALRRALIDVRLGGATQVLAGTTVVIDVAAANRDPGVFGPSACEFDPYRVLPDGVPLWGLSFGTGFHACLGQELAGGVSADGLAQRAALHGSIAGMACQLLRYGARLDPEDPPQLDVESTRPHFGRYPILLD